MGNLTLMGLKKEINTKFSMKFGEKKPFRRPRRRWENNINIYVLR
jgi:hypothetical protein